MLKLKTRFVGTRHIVSRLYLALLERRLENAFAGAVILAVLTIVSPAAGQSGNLAYSPLINGFLNAATALSVNPTAPTGTTQCETVEGTNATSYCDQPTTTIFCGGPIGAADDFSQIPLLFTHPNKTPNTPCVSVTYSFAYSDPRQTCNFYFYVGNGFATTSINATLPNGSKESLDESAFTGWHLWFTASGITSLAFTDASSTTNQKLDIGWGATTGWSIERICS